MKRFAYALPILALLFAAGAQAAPLYDNLMSPEDTNSPDPADPAAAGPLVNSFSTASTPFDFSDLKLRLSTFNENDGGVITVRLLADDILNPGNPGGAISTLGTVNDSALSGASSIEDVIFASIPLAALTRYWIELTAAAPDSPTGAPVTAGGAWAFAANASGFGTLGEFHSNLGNPPQPNADGSGPYEMAIGPAGSSSVPEPITLSLFGAGLAGAGMARRRRKSV